MVVFIFQSKAVKKMIETVASLLSNGVHDSNQIMGNIVCNANVLINCFSFGKKRGSN